VKITIQGLSIKELRDTYGVGSNGFYDHNWYLTEPFYLEKPPAGQYDVDFTNKSLRKTYSEHLSDIRQGYTQLHPAILCEALIKYYINTGTKLLQDVYIRTSTTYEDVGDHVIVGFFGSEGIDVTYCSDGLRANTISILDTKLN
jgi:hypothetical protein